MLKRATAAGSPMAMLPLHIRCGRCIASLAKPINTHTQRISTPAIVSTIHTALAVSARAYVTPSLVVRQEQQQQQQQQQQSASTAFGSSSPTSSGSATGESAMDVAMRVNRMKKAHQSAGGGAATKRQVEAEAWTALNSLNEEQIGTAEGKAVALLLNSWAYFAKFWERGKDGPAAATAAAGSGNASSPPSSAPTESQKGDGETGV